MGWLRHTDFASRSNIFVDIYSLCASYPVSCISVDYPPGFTQTNLQWA